MYVKCSFLTGYQGNYSGKNYKRISGAVVSAVASDARGSGFWIFMFV
jgi:hypothetical protein